MRVVQVLALTAYIKARNEAGASKVDFALATVTRIEPLGMGDRVCVDLCSRLEPGEGLCVGNYSRALFLIHSEVRTPRGSVCHGSSP